MTFNYGPYEGKTIGEVLLMDPSYIVWYHRNVMALDEKFMDKVYKHLKDLGEPQDAFVEMPDGSRVHPSMIEIDPNDICECTGDSRYDEPYGDDKVGYDNPDGPEPEIGPPGRSY